MDLLTELKDTHSNACEGRLLLGVDELERCVRAKAAEGRFYLLLIETQPVMTVVGACADVTFADVLERFLVKHPTLRSRSKVEGIYLKINLKD